MSERMRIKSAARVVQILQILASSATGTSLSEIMTALGLPRSSAYALLDDLVSSGLVEEDVGPGPKTYRVGIGAFEIGMAFLRQRSLAGEAQRIVERIVTRFDETAHLAILDGAEVVYVAKAESSHAMRVASAVGSRLPAHATGVGKALLAQLETDEVVRLYPAEVLPALTPTTVRTRRELLDQLAVVRRDGYAFDDSESTPGLQCLAVPIMGPASAGLAALSLSVPTVRMATMDQHEIREELVKAGAEISHQLGWHDGTGTDARLGLPVPAGTPVPGTPGC